MDSTLKALFDSGRKLLVDTKTPKLTPSKPPKKMDAPVSGDPHKVFVQRTVQEKPKAKDVVEDFKKFITAAEQEL
jgi:hypothetical protein